MAASGQLRQPVIYRSDFVVWLQPRDENNEEEDTELAHWLDAVNEHVDHECQDRPRPLSDPRPCPHAGGRLVRCHVVRTPDGGRFLVVGVDDGDWMLSDFLFEFGDPHDGSMSPAFVGPRPRDDGSLTVENDLLPTIARGLCYNARRPVAATNADPMGRFPRPPVSCR